MSLTFALVISQVVCLPTPAVASVNVELTLVCSSTANKENCSKRSDLAQIDFQLNYFINTAELITFETAPQPAVNVFIDRYSRIGRGATSIWTGETIGCRAIRIVDG